MPAKNSPMPYTEMVAAGEQKKQNKLYRQETSEFSDQQISALVQRTAPELTGTSEKISLTDTGRVKAVTVDYLKSCEDTSTLPTIAGLARALGISRQAVYDCIGRHSPAATAEWFTRCHDAFSDMLTQASLRGTVQPVVSIFVQRAMYGLRESVEIVAKRDDGPLGPEADQLELERKLQDIVVDDWEDPADE